MKALNEKAQEVMTKLVAAFNTTESIVDTLAYMATIPLDVPCAKWSYVNQMLTALAGTRDARGYRQWQEAGRYVKKGAHAFHIFVPRFAKTADDNGEEESRLIGFLTAPVFRVEDTDGAALPNHSPQSYPAVFAVAEKIGVAVEYCGTANANIHGSYNYATLKIELHDQDVATFYHELAHAVHDRVLGKMRDRNDSEKETVAEMAAAVVTRLYEGEEIGNRALQYVKAYKATQGDISRLTNEIMEVVNYVIHAAEEVTKAA